MVISATLYQLCWGFYVDDSRETRNRTDAVLCCPSCFTTICYECKLLVLCISLISRVKNGILSNVNRKYEKDGSNVFLAKKVHNCYVVGESSVQATVSDGTKKNNVYLGHPILCSVCGNEVGFKSGSEYLLMNMIEEDGDINYPVSSTNIHSKRL